jgi:PQQ enzyme repeat
MRASLSSLLVPLLLAAAQALAAEPTNQVLQYHGDAARTGDFIVPSLTWQRTGALHREPNFHAKIEGIVNAQPLFWNPGSEPAMLIVATENDTVYALNAETGATMWEKTLGTPVPGSELPCGNISPLGITGTPVIDEERGAVYLDAMMMGTGGKPEHAVFALSLANGSILRGWPIDVAGALKTAGVVFNTAYQNQRGALSIVGDRVYVPFGGHFGDCGTYHGWVVGLSLQAPYQIVSWQTRADGGAVWAPGGIASDGKDLFVATGNTMDASQWGGGEAVIRLPPNLEFTDAPADYFAPTDWRALDARDLDIGGVAPVLFDLPGQGETKRMALALGKDGKAYLLDRDRLGGIGGALASQPVSTSPIRGGAAAVPADGTEFVAFQGPGTSCPSGSRRGLTVLKIGASPPSIGTAWCGGIEGRGAPMATTTDGKDNAIFWILGAEGDDRLYGFRADNGERLFVSGPLPGLQHFQTLIATPRHLYVTAENAVYVFGF